MNRLEEDETLTSYCKAQETIRKIKKKRVFTDQEARVGTKEVTSDAMLILLGTGVG